MRRVELDVAGGAWTIEGLEQDTNRETVGVEEKVGGVAVAAGGYRLPHMGADGANPHDVHTCRPKYAADCRFSA